MLGVLMRLVGSGVFLGFLMLSVVDYWLMAGLVGFRDFSRGYLVLPFIFVAGCIHSGSGGRFFIRGNRRLKCRVSVVSRVVFRWLSAKRAFFWNSRLSHWLRTF